MSEAQSVLGGATATHHGVTIRDMGLLGMITLRGDLTAKSLAKAVKAATGQAVPGQRKAQTDGENGAFWMSPDELLLTMPRDAVTAALTKLEAGLKGQHSLAVDVSDARAVFQVEGAFAREVVAKIAPVDMGNFGPGDFRRTRLAQVAGAFWMDEAGAITVVCFRSVGAYVFGLLEQSAKSGPVDVLEA